jgi:hypothetical protein
LAWGRDLVFCERSELSGWGSGFLAFGLSAVDIEAFAVNGGLEIEQIASEDCR